ncbi:MAG: HAMP domain-containing sensor histidine kinase [Solirubrobacteraceae bacterium]
MTGAAEAAGWLAAACGAVGAAALGSELRRRTELVVRACHELRGPLTAVSLGVELLARDAPPGRCELAGAVGAELRRAGRALEDLDAARAGRRARDRVEPVDVAALLRAAAAAWAPIARQHGADLQVSVPAGVVVRGDRVRLAQATGNLLANAIEHGSGRVVLRASAGGGRVRIEVSDDGPGLPAPVARIARTARRGRGGRGRGLAIAADIAARHGGRLSAAPSARGARIALELPAAEAA